MKRIMASDPKVKEFLRYLGCRLELCKNVSLFIATGEPVEITETRSCEDPHEAWDNKYVQVDFPN